MKNKILVSSSVIISLVFIGTSCDSATTPNVKPVENIEQTTTNTSIVPITTNTTPTQPISNPPITETKPAPQAPIVSGPKTFTLTEVASHNSLNSCYTIINGDVYDVTNFAPNHPGGEVKILAICGKDGTEAFRQKHSGQPKPEQTLANLKIGVLK